MAELDEYIDTEDVLMTTNYHLVKLLGEGTYGKVILVATKDGKQYAMKLLEYHIDRENSHIDDYYAICESYFTKMFNHPHIIDRLEFGFTQKYAYFMMKQADVVLTDLIPFLGVKTIYQYVYQIADTIHYLHRGGFVYCDVKPSNILIIDGILKISDLGYVKCAENAHCDNYIGSECQTINYRSPEQYTLTKQSISKYNKLFNIEYIKTMAKDNVRGEYWSLGILFLDIIYQTPFITFEGNSHIKITKHSNYLYPAMIGVIADNQSNGISIIDSIISIFGMPADYQLLEVICNHLLQLDPAKRSLERFLNDPIFVNKGYHPSLSPFIFPFVEQMYQDSTDHIECHQLVIDWMIEICTEYEYPLLITMNAIDYYIQHCHLYSKDDLECLAIVSIWLVDRLYNPTDEAVSVDVLTFTTDGKVDIDSFDAMIKSILLSSNGYPVFESLYFYLPDDKLIRMAFNKMTNLSEYIEYLSPRNLADQLMVENDYQVDKLLPDRHNIVTYIPCN